MLTKIIDLWHKTFSSNWMSHGGTNPVDFDMRRWKDGRWEYRDATPAEREEAYWMWAIK